MTWHAAAAFLACTCIGTIHSVVFAGFSTESLHDRVSNCTLTMLITSDKGRHSGKVIASKATVDKALEKCLAMKHCLALKRTGGKWWHEEVAKVPSYCPPEVMASKDLLFILYTSSSTGKPKGVMHMTGRYLLYATLTVKYVFGVHEDGHFACTADVG
ncbi:hypothetical protein B0H17DRAFT_1128300 [Mycena rosella]|uniref:acetate--CoA ligase n=1 Tax=Mycena rosella TaxID=1033263 RepID=A0AAD7DZB8_MYCRO|nr:hypothetical protein B0H17DRAFT_1128300 [Mycena rosella]